MGFMLWGPWPKFLENTSNSFLDQLTDNAIPSLITKRINQWIMQLYLSRFYTLICAPTLYNSNRRQQNVDKERDLLQISRQQNKRTLPIVITMPTYYRFIIQTSLQILGSVFHLLTHIKLLNQGKFDWTELGKYLLRAKPSITISTTLLS